MAKDQSTEFEAFLEHARQRAAEKGPLPDAVLNEVKILLLAQRREIRDSGSLASLTFNTDGLAWRTQWFVPNVLDEIARQIAATGVFGKYVAVGVVEASQQLRAGDWTLEEVSSLLLDPIERVCDYGVRLSTWPTSPVSRSGIKRCAALLLTASAIVDLAALGLELVAAAWARVIGVKDPTTDLVAVGLSQSEACSRARNAGLRAPGSEIQLAESAVGLLVPVEFLSSLS